MNDLKIAIMTRVAKDLEAIEAALKRNLNPYLELVAETAAHILFSGGKRLRPLLMVLSARLCGYEGTQDKNYAVIFEYLHAATLLHDDLVDGAPLRRGTPVAHAVYGSATAVLVGDFLLARSLSLAARTGQPRVIEVIAGITENMSQGEIHQMQKKGDVSLEETEYLEVIRRKTAVLIAGACQVGGLVAGASESTAAALRRYGHHLGMAFQLADDLLDYTSDTDELGKAVGADLREGKLTLPLIHALSRADTMERERVVRLIQSRQFTTAQFQALTDLFNRCGSLQYTRQKALAHIDQAKASLQGFAGGLTRDLLADIADYALLRRS